MDPQMRDGAKPLGCIGQFGDAELDRGEVFRPSARLGCAIAEFGGYRVRRDDLYPHGACGHGTAAALIGDYLWSEQAPEQCCGRRRVRADDDDPADFLRAVSI